MPTGPRARKGPGASPIMRHRKRRLTPRELLTKRWQAQVLAPGHSLPTTIASWDTVTKCVLRGIVIGGVGPSGFVEAHAIEARA